MLSWVREKIAEGRSRWQQTSQQRSPPPLPPPNFDSPSTSPIIINSSTLDDSFASSTQQNAIGNTSHQESQQQQQQQQHEINQCNSQLPNAIRRRSIANLTLQLKEHSFNNKKNDSFSSQKCYSTIANKLEQREHAPFTSRYDKTWSLNGSFTETSTSLIVHRRSNELTVPYVNLRILSIIGYKCSILVPITLTGIDVKQKAIAEFQAKNQLELSNCYGYDERNDCDNIDLIQLSRLYKLTRISKLHDDYDERLSLSRANIRNNEEMLLVRCAHETIPSTASTNLVNTTNDLHTTNIDSEFDDNDIDECSGNIVVTSIVPTQLDIDLVTANLSVRNINGPNVVNIDELVLQSDVQYDIKKILISLSNACAYVIGAGPFAPRIIAMLKQRLIQRKQHENDTQECLIAMGFSRPTVQHALYINNNVYAAALEWLIENQSPTNLPLNDDQSPAMSLSGKFANNATAKDNIESLLEIIRIYCQRELPAPPEMVQMIVEMGFDEASAREALKAAKNHQSYACEWLVGNRSKISQFQQNDGLPSDSPILAALLNSPQVQLSLSNPKIFIAYLSILEDYASMSIWLNDHETSSVIGQVLRTYHEEKHILAINQFSQQKQQQ